MTDIEFVGPQGTVELHGFRRGAREVVGERVLARNLATNPSFEEASGEVVELVNMAHNPSFATLAGISGRNGTVSISTEWATRPGGTSVKHVPSGSSADSNVNVSDGGAMSFGMQGGKTYTIFATFYQASPQTGTGLNDRARTITLYHRAGSGGYTEVKSQVAANVAGPQEQRLTVSLPSGTTDAFIRLYNGSATTTDIVHWDDLCVVEGTYTGGYFDGDTISMDDRAYRWSGAAGSSQSEQYVMGLAGFTNAVQSSLWAVSGTKSLRVLADEYSTTLTIPGTSADTYTVLVTPRLNDQCVSIPSIGATIFTTAEKQVTATVLGGSTVTLTAQLDAGHSSYIGDGWWDNLAIVEGNYQGSWFWKDTPAHGDIVYRLEGDGKTSKVQLLYKPSPEWIFEDMIGWYDLTEDKVPVDERPQGHGAFNVAKSWRSSLAVSVKAHILGADGSNTDVIDEFERFGALGVDGPVEMRVTDSVRTTSRMVSIRNVEAEDEHGHDVGTINIDCVARDPRRYSVNDQWVTGSPLKPSGGLVWPAVWPLVWAGEQGSDGRITLTNQGKKLSSPVYRIYGGYDGFTLTNTGTQQRVGFHWTVPSGSYVELDFATRTATLDGQADVTRYLTVREWWDVTPGKSVTAQLEVDAPSLSPYFAGMVRSAW